MNGTLKILIAKELLSKEPVCVSAGDSIKFYVNNVASYTARMLWLDASYIA
jgi:hypothetical protein